MMNSDKIIFIVGPTAVGKSDVAVCLAQHIQGEIISCDSMQIYKEIDIASNKPSQDVLNKIPHHLVNILSVEEEYDVAQFNQCTLDIIRGIHSRNHIPIIVGGSGMYMQILLDGIFEGGAKNEALRRDLKDQARQCGNQFIYDKLKEMDPEAAGKIHPNDLRRVIRALEICMTEKITISQLQKNRKGLWKTYNIRLFALSRERQELYQRVDARVEQMFQEGIVDEIKKLSDVLCGKTAAKIIGIQEIQGFLRGQYNLEEVKDLIKLNTRHLAKRQLTWFRREKRLEWITIGLEDAPEKISEIIANEQTSGE